MFVTQVRLAFLQIPAVGGVNDPRTTAHFRNPFVSAPPHIGETTLERRGLFTMLAQGSSNPKSVGHS